MVHPIAWVSTQFLHTILTSRWRRRSDEKHILQNKDSSSLPNQAQVGLPNRMVHRPVTAELGCVGWNSSSLVKMCFSLLVVRHLLIRIVCKKWVETQVMEHTSHRSFSSSHYNTLFSFALIPVFPAFEQLFQIYFPPHICTFPYLYHWTSEVLVVIYWSI